MKKQLFLLLLLLCSAYVEARIIQVGPGRTYTRPSQVENVIQDGDTIEIDAAEYVGDVVLWNRNNLLIRGVGGRPHLRANGVRLRWDKAIWLMRGRDIVVENIEFSEATVPLNKGGNGAGIRTEPEVVNLTIRNCYFHHNQNGILIPDNAESNILVEYCEFAYNGFGDVGFTHNIYVNKVQSFTLRFSYSHSIDRDGHLVKSRAAKNYILYNRLSDEPQGKASRLIDLPNGGESYVIGNLLQQGANATNKNLIGYGLEGYRHPKNELYVVNNTMTNERFNGTFLDIANGADAVKAINNLMIGPGDRVIGSAEMLSNQSFDNVNEVGFQDPANGDLRLRPGSDALDAGIDPGTVNGFSLQPVHEYIHPLTQGNRAQVRALDLGAYEFQPPCPPGNAPTFEQFLSICEGEGILVGGQLQTESGIYYDTLSTSAGCDSILVSHLEVKATYLETRFLSICTGDSLWLGGAYQREPGIYQDTLQSGAGCDSIIISTLHLSEQSVVHQEVFICPGDSAFLGGAYQTQAGSYYDTLDTNSGCPPVLVSHLEIRNAPETPRITLSNNNQLCASGNADTYQWFRNGFALAEKGACLQTDREGSYRVLALQNTCASDTSEVFQFTVTSLEFQNTSSGLAVYPNPTQGWIYLRLGEQPEIVDLELQSLDGRSVWRRKIKYTRPDQAQALSGVSPGTYVLSLQREAKVYHQLMVVK